jgi:hypothetical protein
MSEQHAEPNVAKPVIAGIPKDSSRLEMMRREKQMTAEERLTLFEQLARFATWARSAQRVR